MRCAISSLLLTGAGLAFAGCCDESINAIVLWPPPSAPPLTSPALFFVGDSLAMVATADSKPGIPCFRYLYSSATDPDRFGFRSTDTTVASVSPNGVVAARSLGAATISTTTKGFTTSLSVFVEPRFASLRVSVPSAPASVGDTLTVNVDALDAAGNEVPGVYVAIIEESAIDSVIAFVKPSPAPSFQSTLPTPLTLLLRVVKPGIAVLGLHAPHVSSPHQDKIDSVVVRALARSS